MIYWFGYGLSEYPPQYDFSTPDPFKPLLDNPDTQFIHLIELEPYDASLPLIVTGDGMLGALAIGEFDLITGGGIQRVFLSDMGYTTKPADTRPNTHFKALVNNPLQIETSISSSGDFGAGSISYGSIIIENGDKEMDDLARLEWSGRKVVVKVGDRSLAYADFRTIFSGAVEDFETSDDQVTLTIRDNRIRMDQYLYAETYQGTGGLEGGDDIAGQVKPLCFGMVFNIEPRLVDSVNLVYQVHDGSVQSIGIVRDGGVLLTPAGDVPDITAVVPAAGTYITQLSGGYIKLGSTPAARITANVEGDNAHGYVSGAGAILKRIAMDRLSVMPFTSGEIDDGAFTRIDNTQPGPSGFFTDERITASEVADGLIVPLAAYWNFDRLGLLTGGPLDIPENPSVFLDGTNIDAEGPQKLSSVPPAWRVSIGYAPLGVVQGENELAGGANDEDRAFLTSGYRYVTFEDQSLRTRNPRSDDRTVLTRLADKDDAETLLARYQQLFMVPRAYYRVPLLGMLYRVSNGVTARITYPRYGMENGVDLLVVGVSEDAQTGNTTLTLWG